LLQRRGEYAHLGAYVVALTNDCVGAPRARFGGVGIEIDI
jgi:hypothetical protein